MIIHPLYFFSILILAVSGCSSDENTTEPQNETPLAAETMLNVSYGSSPQQAYDIYLPEGRTAEKTKVLLLVHGGGWTSGDKADMTATVTLLEGTHPNHAIVNINYVLAALPNTPAFPNQFLDLKAAIDKLTNERETLQIKPEFGMIGVSAGAHLSLMYDFVYDSTDQVKFVADIVGPSDFTDPFYVNDPQFQLALNFLVDASQYPNGTNLAEAISPAKQVSASSSPALLFYGTVDPLVPLSNGESLDTALTQNNIEHIFSVYEGGHGNDWSEADNQDLQDKISTYINTYLVID